ncbi:MAG: HTTM domain-containing protein [Myxococcota bacterium]|nr:HTTM domain-containing protein [Myxococcota bacterium]
MTNLWTRWTRYCNRQMDPRPLALVRILVPSMIVLDLLRLLQLGLVEVVFRPWEAGGLSTFTDSTAFIDTWSSEWGGILAFGLTLVCMVLVGLGRFMRPAIVIGCLAYAQLGHLYPPGDRAIDRILRCALLFLLFSKADEYWAWNTKKRATRISAWPAQGIQFMLVMIYMAAGISKVAQQPNWLAVEGMPVLYRIMTDPLASNLDPEAWTWAFPLFRIGGWATIFLEVGAFLILTRWCRWWAVGGALMHLGIAATMTLGMFSWGMLALYPLLLSPFFFEAEGAKKTVGDLPHVARSDVMARD